MNTSTTDAEVQEQLKNLTVLYVEDVDLMRAIGEELLSRYVGRLITAGNGALGLDAYKEHKPDIVITDIQMPVMDGLTMLREIRLFDTGKLVPTIILTGLEEVEYLKRSIDLDAYRYVIKPIEPKKFNATLLECARRLLVDKKVREFHDFIKTVVENVRPPILVLDSDLKIIFANRGLCEAFKLQPEESVGSSIFEFGNGRLDNPDIRRLFHDIININASMTDHEAELEFPLTGSRTVLMSARQMIWKSAASNIILISLNDITGRRECVLKNSTEEQI